MKNLARKNASLKYKEEKQKHIIRQDDRSGKYDAITKVEGRITEVKETDAYQVLGIRRHGEFADDTIQTKTATLIRSRLSKEALPNIEDTINMMFGLHKILWAYSMLNSQEKRRIYSKALEVGSYKKDVEDAMKNIVDVYPRRMNQPISETLVSNEKGKPVLRITEEGVLVSHDGICEVDQISSYMIEKDMNGQIMNKRISSNVDMNRLQQDMEYREFVKTLLTEESIYIARKYAAGYLGEIKKINGNWTVSYNPEKMAICRAHQRKLKKSKADKNLTVSHSSSETNFDEGPGGH